MARLKPQEPSPLPAEVNVRVAMGYIEYPGGSHCATCEYSADRGAPQALCTKWNVTINNPDGCCDDWVAFDGKGKDYRKDQEDASEPGEPEQPGTAAAPAATKPPVS
jgi:hypothetical protein